MHNKIIRQGDVLLLKTDTLPEGCDDITPANGVVKLALGEVTGHYHAVRGAALKQKGARRFLVVDATASPLTHQEHSKIRLEPGVYETRDADGNGIVQTDYTPGALNIVAD